MAFRQFWLLNHVPERLNLAWSPGMAATNAARAGGGSVACVQPGPDSNDLSEIGDGSQLL